MHILGLAAFPVLNKQAVWQFLNVFPQIYVILPNNKINGDRWKKLSDAIQCQQCFKRRKIMRFQLKQLKRRPEKNKNKNKNVRLLWDSGANALPLQVLFISVKWWNGDDEFIYEITHICKLRWKRKNERECIEIFQQLKIFQHF